MLFQNRIILKQWQNKNIVFDYYVAFFYDGHIIEACCCQCWVALSYVNIFDPEKTRTMSEVMTIAWGQLGGDERGEPPPAANGLAVFCEKSNVEV